MQLARLLSLAIGLTSLSGTMVMGQTLSYDWLNLPCTDVLHCSNGCSACNLPGDVPTNFFGLSVQWVGMDVCPHPITTADNAVYTTEWPIALDPSVYVGLSAATIEDVKVDSIIIRHRRSADGPQRLRVQFSNDAMQVPTVLGDEAVTQAYEETIFTDLGCLASTAGVDHRGFILRMQAYQGGEGNWQIDALRIVTSPCQMQVGIAENFQRKLEESGTYVDVLGRPVKGQPAPGMYLGGRKRIQVL